MTVAAFRKRFPIGSSERVFLLDDAGRYAGFVLVPELHAPDNDAAAETTTVRHFRQAPASFLTPRQTIDKVLEAFETAEIETLPVVDDATSLRVLGYVTEAYALKRYSQELERRRREYSGER
jgi:CIC family chloride channel protein